MCSRRDLLSFLTFSCSFLIALRAISAAMAEVLMAVADFRSMHFFRAAWVM